METLVTEKYRICEVNNRGILEFPRSVCLGPNKKQLVVCDSGKEKVSMVQLHYPADVIINCNIQHQFAIDYLQGVDFIACMSPGKAMLDECE